MIEIKGISKSFGEQKVLRSIDLTINRGELLSLLGPSGCGKTTLLRILAGFELADDGTVEMEGENLLNKPPQERPIAMVFQNYALFPHMNVEQNIGYALKQQKTDKAKIHEEVDYLLELTRLSHLRGKSVNLLSGGEQQRVAFARALAAKPKVLLLDEPLSNIDAQLREEMRAEIRRLHEKAHVTSIYVTHDQSEALYLSDRVVLMNKGVIEQQAEPEALYDHPATLTAAHFLGCENELPEEILEAFGYQPDFKGRVRAEAVKLLPREAEEKMLLATVEQRFFTGIAHRYFIDAGKKDMVVEVPRGTGQPVFEPGDIVGVTFDRDLVNVYDHEGRRVQ